jgi:hypothetical protein
MFFLTHVVSSLFYPNLLGTKGLVVVVVPVLGITRVLEFGSAVSTKRIGKEL